MRRETIWQKPWFVFLALAPVIGAEARERTSARLPASPSATSAAPAPFVSATPRADSTLPHVEWKFARTLDSSAGDAAPLTVGDTVPYSLEGAVPALPSEAIVASEPKDAELGITVSGSAVPHTLSFTIPGKIQIPARRVVDPTGSTIAFTDPTEVEVKGLELPQDAKPETLYGPISFLFPRAWLIGGITLLLLVLLYAIYRAVKWSRNRKLELARIPEPPKPLHRVVLGRLDAARNGADFKAGNYKRVAYEFSESLKVFLSGTFSIPAEESTTFELVRLLNEAGHPEVGAAAERIYAILDLIKFTDYSASEPEIETLYRDAVQFVSEWKREEILHETR